VLFLLTSRGLGIISEDGGFGQDDDL
jgi:hypothetical protein